MRSLTIRPALNGFVVTIGCAQVVFTSLGTLVVEIQRYYTDPEGVEKEYQGTDHAKRMNSERVDYPVASAQIPQSWAEFQAQYSTASVPTSDAEHQAMQAEQARMERERLYAGSVAPQKSNLSLGGSTATGRL